jgi:hypothetical protein
MLRYYLIATIIVLAIGSVVFAHRIASLRDFQVRGAPRPSMTPTVVRGGDAGARNEQAFTGQGSWAMSALPGCFDEQRSVVGPTTVLTKDEPPASERLAPGTRLRWSGCEIVVGVNDVRVTRGDDRLRVPPQARLYAHDDTLVLVWHGRDGRTEIRTYTHASP